MSSFWLESKVQDPDTDNYHCSFDGCDTKVIRINNDGVTYHTTLEKHGSVFCDKHTSVIEQLLLREEKEQLQK